jgi:hypothetical protein
MKTSLTIKLLVLLALPIVSFGQTVTPKLETTATTDGGKTFDPHYSLIVGLGASVIARTIYQNPAVNNGNNNVIIEDADKLRYTATLGFSYTPYIWKIKSIDSKGNSTTVYKPKGITVAIFANPLSLSTITGNNTSFDWGTGIGYRFVGMSILATVEFFTIRQPKDYFITDFKSNDKQYIINNSVQKEIATTDDNIFRNKAMVAFGAKLVIPIDVLKNL